MVISCAVLPECFVILCRRHETVPDGKAGPFLFGTARKVLMAHRRKLRHAALMLARLMSETVQSKTSACEVTPRDLIDKSMRAETLLAAIDSLSDRQKEALRLVHFQNLSRAEAARKMAIKWQTLHVHEQVALERLRGLLKTRQSDGA